MVQWLSRRNQRAVPYCDSIDIVVTAKLEKVRMLVGNVDGGYGCSPTDGIRLANG